MTGILLVIETKNKQSTCYHCFFFICGMRAWKGGIPILLPIKKGAACWSGSFFCANSEPQPNAQASSAASVAIARENSRSVFSLAMLVQLFFCAGTAAFALYVRSKVTGWQTRNACILAVRGSEYTRFRVSFPGRGGNHLCMLKAG